METTASMAATPAKALTTGMTSRMMHLKNKPLADYYTEPSTGDEGISEGKRRRRDPVSGIWVVWKLHRTHFVKHSVFDPSEVSDVNAVPRVDS